MNKACIAVFLVVLLCSSGSAQSIEESTDLSGYAGMFRLDKGGTEFMFGIRYSYNMDEHHSFEGTLGYLRPENVQIYLYHANYRYNLSLEGQKVVPFFTGGIGAISYFYADDAPDYAQTFEGSSLAFNFGLGLQYFQKENLAIRFDIRDIIIRFGERTVGAQTLDLGNTNNVEITAGISYFFI